MSAKNHRNLDHAIKLQRAAIEDRAKVQSEFNLQRIARFEKAVATTPVFIPLKFSLEAVSQLSPYQDETPDLPYDVIVTGIIADNTTREINIRDAYKDLPYVYVGKNKNLKLTLADIAGGTYQTEKGQKGIFTLPSPITISSGNQLYFDVYKTDETVEPEEINICLVGYRVHKSNQLDSDERTRILTAIGRRDRPRNVFLKQEIDFETADAGGKVRNVYTPKVEEPLLILGCRSTLRHSTVEMKINGGNEWTTKPTPIWAIAAEDDNETSAYMWFQREIYLPTNGTIEETLENSINGSNIDPQINQITWICQTA